MTTEKKRTTKKYEQKGKTIKIRAVSRCAIKVKDNFYTIEAEEERGFTSGTGIDVDKEWELLFNEVNTIVDNQCQEIINTFK